MKKEIATLTILFITALALIVYYFSVPESFSALLAAFYSSLLFLVTLSLMVNQTSKNQ